MKPLKRFVLVLDRWQRRHPIPGVTYAVVKKFSDDDANLLVVALGWYGFTAIYPLLLVVVTIFGFIGVSSLGTGIVNTLHQFPVIGTDFNTSQGGSNLHGSVVGLIVGVAGLLYGAQGVTQTAQQAMAQAWNVPRVKLPGFLPRLGRSLLALLIIGGTFVLNAFLASVAAGYGLGWLTRIGLLVVLLTVNTVCYLVSFLTLTPPKVTRPRRLLPGAIMGAVGFTFLTTVGTGLVQHQLRHSAATYGAFASVIGVVTYLLLLAKLSVYAAELNAVRARRLWPRALPGGQPTQADDKVLHDLAHEQQVRPGERIGVGLPPNATNEAADDARGRRDRWSPRPHGGDRTDWSTQPSMTPIHRRF